MAARRNDADTVRFLMANAAKFPMLTGEQEIELGREVQAMMRVLELPEDERPEQWSLIVGRGKKAKDRMIQSNLRLVIAVAKKYRNLGLPLEDLIQEGSIGLSRGVELFDPERGYKLSTYLFAWIKQGITRAIENKSRMIRLPADMKRKVQKLKYLTREMMQETGRRPSAEILREAMELDERKWNLLISSLADATSYDIIVSAKDDETRLIDLLSSELATPQDMLDMQDQYDRVELLFTRIGEREANLLRLRYGIGGRQPKTLEELGRIMGISRERVRQIENKAMKSARKVAAQV